MILDGERQVGLLERATYPGERRALHLRFDLDVAWQGKGVARELQRAAVAQYDACGIRSYTITADEGGRYAWARFGVDLLDLEAYRAEYARAAGELGDPEAIARCRHAWDFAELEHGRAIMLRAPAWRGRLDLRPSSPGRQRFDAYVR